LRIARSSCCALLGWWSFTPAIVPVTAAGAAAPGWTTAR
jgi:hypothetical protein